MIFRSKEQKPNLLKYSKKGDPLDWERIKQYIDKGIKSFCVTSEEYRTYLLFIEGLAAKFINNKSHNTNISTNETMLIVKEMINLVSLEILVDTKIDENSIGHASTVVTGCLQTMEQDPKSLNVIMRLMCNHAYLMKHSISVSIFSILLAKEVNIESERTLKNIGLGGLLHDIGVAQLTFDPENLVVLSPEQWQEVKTHPELGKRKIDGLNNITTEVIDIVMQHHEQPNGNGYPNKLRNADIFMPAKIVAIADSFSALITKRPHRDAKNPTEALAILKSDSGKFDKKILEQFSNIFLLPND